VSRSSRRAWTGSPSPAQSLGEARVAALDDLLLEREPQAVLERRSRDVGRGELLLERGGHAP
jgi:hypothetical protein